MPIDAYTASRIRRLATRRERYKQRRARELQRRFDRLQRKYPPRQVAQPQPSQQPEVMQQPQQQEKIMELQREAEDIRLQAIAVKYSQPRLIETPRESIEVKTALPLSARERVELAPTIQERAKAAYLVSRYEPGFNIGKYRVSKTSASFLLGEVRRGREKLLSPVRQQGKVGRVSAFAVEAVSSPFVDVPELVITKPKLGVPLAAVTIAGGYAVGKAGSLFTASKLGGRILGTAGKKAADIGRKELRNTFVGRVFGTATKKQLEEEAKGLSLKVSVKEALGVVGKRTIRTYKGKQKIIQKTISKPVFSRSSSFVIKEGVGEGKKFKIGKNVIDLTAADAKKFRISGEKVTSVKEITKGREYTIRPEKPEKISGTISDQKLKNLIGFKLKYIRSAKGPITKAEKTQEVIKLTFKPEKPKYPELPFKKAEPDIKPTFDFIPKADVGQPELLPTARKLSLLKTKTYRKYDNLPALREIKPPVLSQKPPQDITLEELKTLRDIYKPRKQELSEITRFIDKRKAAAQTRKTKRMLKNLAGGTGGGQKAKVISKSIAKGSGIYVISDVKLVSRGLISPLGRTGFRPVSAYKGIAGLSRSSGNRIISRSDYSLSSRQTPRIETLPKTMLGGASLSKLPPKIASSSKALTGSNIDLEVKSSLDSALRTEARQTPKTRAVAKSAAKTRQLSAARSLSFSRLSKINRYSGTGRGFFILPELKGKGRKKKKKKRIAGTSIRLFKVAGPGEVLGI